MASLNLDPNPAVLVVQAGIFLAAIVSVKKLYVNPYLSLRDKRDHATIDQKTRAQDLALKNEELSSEIHARFEKAKSDIHDEVDKIRLEMKKKREEILEESNGEAKSLLAKVRADISSVVDEERKKLTSAIPSLTDELYNKAIN